MNKDRRAELQDVCDLLDEAISRLEEIKGDEEDAYYNLPEGLQMSKTGDRMQEAIDKMDKWVDAIEAQKQWASTI